VGENSKQEVEQQVQKATTENNPGERVEANPSGLGDETSEKGPKKTESSGETTNDITANKVKSEAATSEVARIASTLTEEPEAQEQTATQGRTDEVAEPPVTSRPTAVAEPQPPVRATPLYWRRLTARYT